MSDLLDCLIIGEDRLVLPPRSISGGFGGAFWSLIRGWSRAEWITKSHNLPGFPEGIAGPVLLGNLRAQARRYGASIEAGIVDALDRDDNGMFLAKIGASIVRARTVILATGVTENNPPVSHVADAVKRGFIRTCPICDGYESMGKNVAVLGKGEHAAGEALFLRTYTNKLSLLLMQTDAALLSQDTLRALQAAEINVAHVVIGSVSVADDSVTILGVEDGQEHRFDIVYTAFGTTSQTILATGLGARMDASKRLFVNEHQETSVDGFFAAGDLVRGLNQISVAEGEAATAATSVHNHLPRVFA